MSDYRSELETRNNYRRSVEAENNWTIAFYYGSQSFHDPYADQFGRKMCDGIHSICGDNPVYDPLLFDEAQGGFTPGTGESTENEIFAANIFTAVLLAELVGSLHGVSIFGPAAVAPVGFIGGEGTALLGGGGLGPVVARAPSMCWDPNPSCGALASAVQQQVGGRIITIQPEGGRGVLDTLPGVAKRGGWEIHKVNETVFGKLIDPLRGVVYSGWNAFVRDTFPEGAKFDFF